MAIGEENKGYYYKCKHITFTLRRREIPRITIRNSVQQTKLVKYFELHLDSKLIWKKCLHNKIRQIRTKRKEMFWLISRKSKLSIEKKIIGIQSYNKTHTDI